MSLTASRTRTTITAADLRIGDLLVTDYTTLTGRSGTSIRTVTDVVFVASGGVALGGRPIPACVEIHFGGGAAEIHWGEAPLTVELDVLR